MKMHLKYKLIVSYLIVSLVTIGTLLAAWAYLITSRFNEYVMRSMESQMNLLATQINLELNRTQQDATNLNWESFSLAALEQGFILRIEDGDQGVIWCTDCVYQQQCRQMLAEMEDTMKKANPSFQGEYMEKRFDLIQRNQIIGTMILGHFGPYYYSRSEVAFLAMMKRLFVFGALGFLVFAVFLGFLMARRISRPIDEVITGTKRIAKGNYDERVESKTTTLELEELIASVNQLAESLSHQLQIKRNMAIDYAHEFRTPLAVLRSSLEGMIDGVWDVTPQRLQSLHEEIMRLTRMVEGIEHLVEVEDQGFALQVTTVKLQSLIRDVINNFAMEMHDKGLTVTLEGEEVSAQADPDRLRQVMVNLISNAIKYSQPDTHVTISVMQTGSEAVIAVKDEGIGIAGEDLPYIFEHLYRADKSRSYDAGGSGIGLSIVLSIVEAHGGRITVDSVPKQGSTFTIYLPIYHHKPISKAV